MMELPFQFEIPVDFFEKANADAGKQRRIGGIISTESPDRQGEVILSKGLEFGEFLQHGWFNDNHSKRTTDILGYPEMVQLFQKGEKLPNGEMAGTNGVWAEGYLLDTPAADSIWKLGKALAKTGRRLGFSVEGSVLKRAGTLRKTVAKAVVRNVAITNCPVNTDSRLEVLTKSLIAVSQSEDDLDKALAMGPANPGAPPEGGAVLATESLEADPKEMERRKKEAKSKKKPLSKAEAVAWVQSRLGCSNASAGRIVEITEVLKHQGRL